MEENSPLVYALGFLAQGFFSARMLIQWIASERAKRVLSPNSYWICSLAGSVLLFLYGWIREDFAIILGQFISYYIYIWNLNMKGIWSNVPCFFRWCIGLLPISAFVAIFHDLHDFLYEFFGDGDISTPLLIWGSAGQLLFTLRFIYQWRYSHKAGESALPIGFWVISLAGSLIIVSYGVMRCDPVLILGQSAGFFTYFRNIVIYRRSNRS